MVRIIKKKLPTVFICPRCGEEAVRVTIAKDTGKATVMCALCQLKDEFQAHPAAQMIDVYSFFADKFYGVKDPRAIMPRQREAQAPMPGEEESEPEPAGAHVEVVEEPFRSEEYGPTASGPEESLEPQPETPIHEESAEPALSTAEESGVTSSGPFEEGPEAASEKSSEEEDEPFADILGRKDKKRYSPNPLPQEQSEQTSQASD